MRASGEQAGVGEAVGSNVGCCVQLWLISERKLPWTQHEHVTVTILGMMEQGERYCNWRS